MFAFIWQFKIKKEQQLFIISLLFVWNNFTRKRNTAKSDLIKSEPEPCFHFSKKLCDVIGRESAASTAAVVHRLRSSFNLTDAATQSRHRRRHGAKLDHTARRDDVAHRCWLTHICTGTRRGRRRTDYGSVMESVAADRSVLTVGRGRSATWKADESHVAATTVFSTGRRRP